MTKLKCEIMNEPSGASAAEAEFRDNNNWSLQDSNDSDSSTFSQFTTLATCLKAEVGLFPLLSWHTVHTSAISAFPSCGCCGSTHNSNPVKLAQIQ